MPEQGEYHICFGCIFWRRSRLGRMRWASTQEYGDWTACWLHAAKDTHRRTLWSLAYWTRIQKCCYINYVSNSFFYWENYIVYFYLVQILIYLSILYSLNVHIMIIHSLLGSFQELFTLLLFLQCPFYKQQRETERQNHESYSWSIN